MAFDGTAWNEATPDNSDVVNEGDDNIRDVKSGVRARMAVEHLWPSSQSATNEAGLHRYLTFEGQTASPGLVVGTNTQQGALYVSDTTNSLIFKNSAGSEITVVAGATDTGGLIPTGSMLPYGANKSPAGWILCTGGAVSRTTFDRLFNVLGTVWGTGDGSTTFNVPDMRGRAAVGKSASGLFASLATVTGTETHTLVVGEIPSHTHSQTLNTDSNGGTSGKGVNSNGGGSDSSANVTSTGSGGAHTNVQPSAVTNYIIKD